MGPGDISPYAPQALSGVQRLCPALGESTSHPVTTPPSPWGNSADTSDMNLGLFRTKLFWKKKKKIENGRVVNSLTVEGIISFFSHTLNPDFHILGKLTHKDRNKTKQNKTQQALWTMVKRCLCQAHNPNPASGSSALFRNSLTRLRTYFLPLCYIILFLWTALHFWKIFTSFFGSL